MTEVRPVSDHEVRAKRDELFTAIREAIVRESGKSGVLVGFGDDPEENPFWGVSTRFESVLYGDPERLDDMLSEATKATRALSDDPKMLCMTNVAATLKPWQGNAADIFHEVFVSQFPQIAANHVMALSGLINAIKSSQGIMYTGRQSALEIADQTIAALRQIKKKPKGSPWKTILPIVGVVLTVVAAGLPFIGVALSMATATTFQAAAAAIISRHVAVTALTLTLAGQGVSLANANIAEPAVGGTTVMDIVKSMHAAFDTLWDGIEQERMILNNAVNDDITRLEPNLLLPPEPDSAAAGVKDRNAFRPPPADD